MRWKWLNFSFIAEIFISNSFIPLWVQTNMVMDVHLVNNQAIFLHMNLASRYWISHRSNLCLSYIWYQDHLKVQRKSLKIVFWHAIVITWGHCWDVFFTTRSTSLLSDFKHLQNFKSYTCLVTILLIYCFSSIPKQIPDITKTACIKFWSHS